MKWLTNIYRDWKEGRRLRLLRFSDPEIWNKEMDRMKASQFEIFCSKECKRVAGKIAEQLAKQSPWSELINGGTFPDMEFKEAKHED